MSTIESTRPAAHRPAETETPARPALARADNADRAAFTAVAEPDFALPRRPRRWGLWLFLALLLAGIGTAVWLAISAFLVPIEVRVQVVDEGAIEQTLTEDGAVRPRREANITAEIPGRIAAIEVKEGDRVVGGQVLFRLEAEHLQARLPMLEARLEASRKAADEAEIRQAHRMKDLRRMEKLRETAAVTQQDYDDALSESQMSRAQYEASLAEITRTEAELAEAKIQLGRSAVRAPFPGVVDSVDLDLGEMVAMGFGDIAGPSTDVMTLVDLDDLYVEAEVAEADIGMVHEGQEVRITADALGERIVPGVVERVQLHARPKKILTRYERSGEEKVFLANIKVDSKRAAEQGLRPGLTVYVTVGVAAREGVRLSRSCIFSEENQFVAYVVEGGRLQRRVLKVGLQGGEYVEVLDGLQAGQRVAVRGAETLTDAMTVRAVEARASR